MTRTRFHPSVRRATLIATISAAGACATAQQMQQVTYDVSHAFVFNPGGDVAEVTGYEFRHAWVRAGIEEHAEVFPVAQDPGFDIWGVDSMIGGWGAWNTGIFSAVPAWYEVYSIPTTGVSNPPGPGFPPNGCTFIELPFSVSRALACNSIEVDPWTNQAPLNITGLIHSYGYAWPNASQGNPFAASYAFSTSAVSVRSGYQLASGAIQWIPGFLIDSVGGSASAQAFGRVYDPILLTATNTSNGDVFEYGLLDVQIEHAGTGRAEWSGNSLAVDLPEFEMRIGIPDAVIDPTQAGDLYVRVESGVVTQSQGSGIFAGSAPALGLSVPFVIDTPDLRLDYDLGLDPDQPWFVEAKLSGGGDSDAGVTGPACPADINRDGLLNFFDVSEFIGLFLEQHPGADFTGDGAFDFFDIAIFLDAFLAGCQDAGPSD